MARQKGIPVTVTAVHRFIFVIAFGTTGFILGREIDLQLLSLHVTSSFWQGCLRLVMPVVGAFIGVFISPFAQGLFETELAMVEAASEKLTPLEIAGGTVGLFCGLLISLFLRALFSGIIAEVGMAADAILLLAAIICCVFLTYLGLRIGGRSLRQHTGSDAASIVLDTSAIIDGRIVEIVRCGFIEGALVVPRCVLLELQRVADSSDAMKRARGRRGLELLDELRNVTSVRIEDDDVANAGLPVDMRILRFAHDNGSGLMTTDYNLNRVARLEGVKVMNVNELAHALRPALVAGQSLEVIVTKEGRESDQGVGYLDDGTMIVIEGGRAHIGEAVSIVVTSVLQTAAGRMVFARAA
jgi:uncharacterized protein YacL